MSKHDQDTRTLRIAIVGAGFAGLATAKVLSRFGHEVMVFERCPDVGGVWSATRRYPGLRTQNVKSTYAFSDFPLPREVPEWPTGEHMQAYLEAYVERFELAERVRLGTEVVAAELDETSGTWTLQTADATTGAPRTDTFNHLVVANGIYCEPLVPAFAGAKEHRGGRRARSAHEPAARSRCGPRPSRPRAGVRQVGVRRRRGRVRGRGQHHARRTPAAVEAAPARGGRPELQVPRAHAPGRATVPARRAPRRRAPAASTRAPAGAADARHPAGRRHQAEPPAQARPRPARNVRRARQQHREHDHRRFFAKVRRGQITVHRDANVTRLLADGQPRAELTDGARVPADLVLCGTGFQQRVPFLSEELQRRIADERGNFQLYRQVLAVDVPHLSFAGYNSSFFSPLSAEIAALWTASLLSGVLTLPPAEEMRAHVRARVRWMEERTGGRHARGASIIPFSMRNVDELLDDIGIDVAPLTRLRQWLLPIDPRAYRSIEQRLLGRRGARRPPRRNARAIAREGVDGVHPVRVRAKASRRRGSGTDLCD